MANIVLNTKTYVYAGTTAAGVVTYQERSSGVVSGFGTLDGLVRYGDRTRITSKMYLPVIAADNSSCACTGEVLRSCNADVNLRFDNTMTTAERTDFALRFKDWAASPAFQNLLIYGTSINT